MRCCTKVTNALTVMRLLYTYAQISLASNMWCHSFPVLHSFPHNVVCRMENGASCLAFLFLFRFKLKKSWCITNILLVHPSHPINPPNFGGGPFKRFHCYVSWRMSKMHLDAYGNLKVLSRSLYYTAYFILNLFYDELLLLGLISHIMWV